MAADEALDLSYLPSDSILWPYSPEKVAGKEATGELLLHMWLGLFWLKESMSIKNESTNCVFCFMPIIKMNEPMNYRGAKGRQHSYLWHKVIQ